MKTSSNPADDPDARRRRLIAYALEKSEWASKSCPAIIADPGANIAMKLLAKKILGAWRRLAEQN